MRASRTDWAYLDSVDYCHTLTEPGATVAAVAMDMKVDESTARRWLDKLKKAGLLIVNEGRPKTYFLTDVGFKKLDEERD